MILVDAHIHIHHCFDLQIFLDSALSNFRAEAVRSQQENDFSAVLLLAESKNTNWFKILQTYAYENYRIGSENSYWTFHPTAEQFSLWARQNYGHTLCIIAGRQIVTEENLEVLALGIDTALEDGASLQKVLEDITNSNAIPVIPWGVGKWIGPRGTVLSDTLRNMENKLLFLGDNGGRPYFWPRPSHFKAAEQKGLRILPGSDPLPFPSEARRPGSYGFTLQTSIGAQEPAKDLKALLFDPEVSVQPYGKLERPYRFFKNQFRMQMRKIVSAS